MGVAAAWPAAPGRGGPGRGGSGGGGGRRGAGQVGDGDGGLVQVLGAQHEPDPAVQFVQAEQAHRVVLPQQCDQPFAVGLGGQRPRTPGAGHGYVVGRTTTADP